MKKKLMGISIICLLMILVIVISLIMAGLGRTQMPATLYVPDNNNKSLIKKDVDITYTDHTYIPQSIIKKLQQKGAIPKTTVVNFISFDSADSITVDFTKDFLTEDYRFNVLRTYAVVKSICSTSQYIGIQRVRVTVDDKPVMTSDGKALGYISDVSLNIMSDEQTIVTACDLYFKDKKNEIFKSERRNLDALGGPIEHNAVEALIEGPYLKNLEGVFPRGTRLISAEAYDGICYVNFAPFPKGADTDDIKTSLIYTLTALDGIDSVKILINGQLQNY